MARSNKADEVVKFAGLTRHNLNDITDEAVSITGMDTDNLPETSFTTAIRDLETADSGDLAWKIPEDVAGNIQENELDLPEGVKVNRLDENTVYVETDRFQSIYSPDKLREWAKGEDGESVDDPLWYVPTKTYSVVNPLTAYTPLEEAIRDQELGDSMFGEIRTYKGGGEVHMDILFDAYSIDYSNDEDGRDPIVLGISTGYDFFGSQALYFEGFAQDTRCSNSIRSITEKKTIRHVGDVDLDDEIEDILEEMELMTSRLAELIELAEDIEVDMLDMDFSSPFDHNDDYRAFYELAGFPTYIAKDAASHARQRADNQFTPDMTALWDGATYALTYSYSGGENTATAEEYIETANDMVMNPSQTISTVNHQHQVRMSNQKGEQQDLNGESARANIEEFSQTVKEKADEFESRSEEMRKTLIAESDGGEE